MNTLRVCEPALKPLAMIAVGFGAARTTGNLFERKETNMDHLLAIASAIGVIAFGAIAIPSGASASGCDADASSIAAHIFDMSDADADGFLTPDEFADAGLERYGIPFDAYDENGDGEASADEYFDLFELHHPPQEAI